MDRADITKNKMQNYPSDQLTMLSIKTHVVEPSVLAEKADKHKKAHKKAQKEQAKRTDGAEEALCKTPSTSTQNKQAGSCTCALMKITIDQKSVPIQGGFDPSNFNFG